MKFRVVLAAAALLSLTCVQAPAAAITGTFNIAGTVTATLDSITWTANYDLSPPDEMAIGPGATGDFAAVSTTHGTIADLNRSTQPVGSSFGPDPFIGFLTNPTGLPSLMITYIYPGYYSSAGCTASPAAVADTCTLDIPGGSPFNFVNNPPPDSLTSTATWVVQGVTSDNLSSWYGVFTSQFDGPFQDIVAEFGPNGSGTVSNTYSATIVVSANAVPEPGTLAIMGFALILLGSVMRRRTARANRAA